HGIVGEAVRSCIAENRKLEELTLERLRAFSDKIDSDVFDVLPVRACVERRGSRGGTSSSSTDAQISEIISQLMARDAVVRQETQFIEGCWDELLGGSE
ncbi:MAG: argininosuccinate lyase, partial [Candidatus Methanoplasma sp.]|nr:argininosuccinate lyase [Candidatus Methanoplasma sp.]